MRVLGQVNASRTGGSVRPRTAAPEPLGAPRRMNDRTTTTGRAAGRRDSTARSRRRRLLAYRRPGLYLGVAAAGAVLVNVLVGVGPTAQAEAEASQSVSVAQALGLASQQRPEDAVPDLAPLQELAASRGSREAAEVAAQQAQAAADQAELDRQRAEAEAAAAAAAAEAAAAEAAAEAESETAADEASGDDEGAAETPAGTAVTAVARITNSAGAVAGVTQAAANAVVSNVPGAGSITLGGTRASAADPGGHPSGRALDYMVLSDTALGNAIVQYHIANWDALGVDYLIYRQRILQSPGGSWTTMEDRGSVTQNHMDHVHVNYN